MSHGIYLVCGQCLVVTCGEVGVRYLALSIPIAVITSNKNLRHDNLDLVVEIFNLVIVILCFVRNFGC